MPRDTKNSIAEWGAFGKRCASGEKKRQAIIAKRKEKNEIKKVTRGSGDNRG
jgi:hypothetical protein